MRLLDKLRYPRTNSVYLDGANRVFKARCADEGAIHTDVYRNHPSRKAQDWQKIRDEIGRLCAGPDGSEKTKRLRKRFAESLDAVVATSWYLKLPDDERELIARHIFNSTTAEQDRGYYFTFPYWFMLGAILESFIFYGWSGSEVARDKLKQLQTDYMDYCRQHCGLLLQIAKAKSEGRELTDTEKEGGKTIQMFREMMRRALSGEKVLDDAPD